VSNNTPPPEHNKKKGMQQLPVSLSSPGPDPSRKEKKKDPYPSGRAVFGVVFKSHIAPSDSSSTSSCEWVPMIVFYRMTKTSSDDPCHADDDDPEVEDDGIQLRDHTSVSVCPSSEFVDFSNEVDRFEPTLLCCRPDTTRPIDDTVSSSNSSCLLFMRVRPGAPSRCPVKVSLYVGGSILVSEVCFTVITRMTSTAASLYRNGSSSSPLLRKHPINQQHQGSPLSNTRLMRYSLEALSSWQVASSPIVKSLFILCLYPGVIRDDDGDDDDDDHPRRDASLVDELLRASMDLLLPSPGSISIRIAHASMGGAICDILPVGVHPPSKESNHHPLLSPPPPSTAAAAATHSHDKVQVMLFPGRGAASFLSPEQWRQCRVRFPSLDDAARSSKIASQQQHSALSLSVCGSIPHTGSALHSSLSPYEWLRRSSSLGGAGGGGGGFGLDPRVLSSPSPSLSQHRWTFCRLSDDDGVVTAVAAPISEEDDDDDAEVVSVAYSIDLRTRFLSSVGYLTSCLRPYQSRSPLGLILLPTASSSPSSSSPSSPSRGIDHRSVEWNRAHLSSTMRAYIADHSSHYHDDDDDSISTQQDQHSLWQLHLICQGLYPLSPSVASSSIVSLTCMLDGFEEKEEERVGGKGRSELLHQLLPLLKTVVALLLAHLVASSIDIIIPAIAFPSYISSISRAFDLSSLMDLNAFYDIIELDYLSRRYHGKNKKKKRSSSRSRSPSGASSRNKPSRHRTAVPATPSDASSSSSITSTHVQLRTAVMYLEEASLLIQRRGGIDKCIEQLQRILHRSAAIEASEGQLIRYALDKAYYWTTPQRVSEGTECWKALSALLVQPFFAGTESSSTPPGGGVGKNTFSLAYDHLYRSSHGSSSSSSHTSPSMVADGFDSMDAVMSSLQLDYSAASIESKQKDLQLTLMQVLINDIGVRDIKLAHDAAQCLMRQGCSSYPDLISLGALFTADSDGSFHSVALRTMLHEGGIPLFVAAKLATHIEAALTII